MTSTTGDLCHAGSIHSNQVFYFSEIRTDYKSIESRSREWDKRIKSAINRHMRKEQIVAKTGQPGH